MRYQLIAFLFMSGIAPVVAAQATQTIPASRTSQAPVLRIARRTASIVIDGQLNDADWQGPPTVDSLTQSSPIEGAVASERSEIWMTFDDEAIFVAARFHDATPDSIMAFLVRRDRQNQSDLFMLYLDPYRDGQNGYQFIVNAAGVQRDGTLFADNFTDDTWDAVWDSAVERSALGWTVEVRIPFSQLRMRDGTSQRWGVNFGRGIGRRSEISFLVPRLRQGAGFVSRFLEIEGLSGIRPRARRELIPYVTERLEARPALDGDPFFRGRRYTPTVGMDFRLGLGANLQVDGAVNPDFGQVEVDPAIVNLSDFEVFFQERRPFFVEGTNIFRFGQAVANVSYDWPTITPFYSRRIGRPPAGRATAGATFVDAPSTVTILGASKLTGRIGEWNVGTLGALTGREHARSSGPHAPQRTEIEPLAAYTVARAQRAVSKGRHGIGFLGSYAGRSFDNDQLRNDVNRSATFAGVDGWLGLDNRRTWLMTGQLGTSRVTADRARLLALQLSPSHYFQRPDAPHVSLNPEASSLSGAYGRIQLEKQRGAMLFHSAIGAISPGFDANDLGFAARTDHINAHVMTGRRWTQPGRWFQQGSANVALASSWDFGGSETHLSLVPGGTVQFRNFSGVWGTAQLSAESYDIRATRGGPKVRSPAGVSTHVGWYSDVRRPIHFGSSFRWSTAAMTPPSFLGDLSVEWRPTSNLNLELTPSINRTRSAAQPIRSIADSLATQTFGRRYVFGELDQRTFAASLRADWIFSPRASFELFVQPLVTTIRYPSLRELVRPGTLELRTYGSVGSTYDRATGEIDPDGPGPAEPFSVGQPEYTFASIRGNAVLRWEYLRGSTLYLVWTQNRSALGSATGFSPAGSLSDLVEQPGNHVLLLKLSYWLSR